MLILASIRSRWAGLIVPFLSLAFGVALTAAAGLVLWGTLTAPPDAPQRYAHAAAVAVPTEELTVRTGHGVRSQPLAVRHGLTPADLAALGPGVIDRYAYAQLAAGGPDQVGRPWPAAASGTHRLTAGRGPQTDGEVVVWAGGGVPGQAVTVLTVDGPRAYTVCGVLAPARFERALFFTAAETARLSPRVDALILPTATRPAVPSDVEVHSGPTLRRLDPDADRDARALVAATALVATAGGIALFVSGFVVASSVAYALARRRRELALLRTVGATPGQVRRIVAVEGTTVGVLATLVGCWLGRLTAPRFAAALVDRGLAPDWFTAPDVPVPLVLAALAGLLAAAGGLLPATWRAGRVRPLDALREAVVDRPGMPLSRWLCGGAALAGALYLLVGPVVYGPAEALRRKSSIPGVMLLVLALAVLAPVLVPPAARLLGWPLVRLPGATGLLVRETARAGTRRTAATAAPVLLAIGLATSLLGATATIDRARADEARPPGAVVVVPAGTPGLNRAAVDRLRALPGVEVSAAYPTTVYDLEDGTALLRRPAQAVDPGALRVLPVLSGSVDDLRDDTIVVDTDWHRGVGDTVRVWLADGSPATLRVAAVIREGVGGHGAFLTRAHVAGDLAARAVVRSRTGASPRAVADAVRTAVAGTGAAPLPVGPAPRRGVTLAGIWVVIGVAVAYAGLSGVGTVLMAGTERGRDLAMLRAAGATTGQVIRVVVAEALFVTGLGLALALVAAAVTLAGLWVALLRLTGGSVALSVPWDGIGAVTAGVAALVLLAHLASIRTARPGSPRP